MVHDGRTGLAVRVTDRGERSWLVRPLLGKAHIWCTLGSYPETTLEDARTLARGALRAAADRVDPRPLARERLRSIAAGELNPRAAARGAHAGELTFGELVTKFVQSPAVAGKSSERETRRILTTYFLTESSAEAPSVNWKTVAVAELDRREINGALELLVARGHVQANACARTLNRLLRWAAKKGYVEAVPVFDTAPGGREDSRERVLAGWELRAIWNASLAEPVFGPFVRFLAATGLRRTNAASVKRDHVDWKRKMLTIPRTKEGRVFLLPLNAVALEAIDAALSRPAGRPETQRRRDRRIERITESDYVFSASGKPLNAWSKMTDRLRAGAPKVTERWTLHDLRRTFRTGLSELGVEYQIAERCIDHVVGDAAAQTYDRWQYLEEKRDAFDRWAKNLRRILVRKR
jgi:integrase